MKEFIQSKVFKIVAAIIGGFLIVVVIFGAGVAVGLHKARFSENFGKNYERNFMGSRFQDENRGDMMNDRRGFVGGMMNQVEGRDLRNGYGLSGTVISVTDSNIVIKDQDNKESTVTVSDKTLIKSQSDNLKLSDLKVDDKIVVMGNPGDNGAVNASLIRVFPNTITN